MNKKLCMILCIGLILSLGQAMAFINVNMSFSPNLLLMPGIDTVRQSVLILSLEADQPYTVELSSRSGGVMVNGINTIPYRVSYDNGADLHLTEAAQLVESNSSTSLVSREIAVTILGADTASAIAGDYSSTLVVTVTSL